MSHKFIVERLWYLERVFAIVGVLLPAFALAQQMGERGHSIGHVTTDGYLIVIELDENALGDKHLFNLDHRTLKFVPERDAYRVSNLPLRWDGEFGGELKDHEISLHNFKFPFSGKAWDTFSVANTGVVTFGASQGIGNEGRAIGFPISRFDQLRNAGAAIVNTVPGISVFLKPRMSGPRYWKELADRAVITWDLTEPWGGIQDFTWKPTINRFQLTLAKDGSMEMSYNDVAAKDAIVGVYPLCDTGAEQPLTTLRGSGSESGAPYLNITNLRLSIVDGLFLKVQFRTSGPVLHEGDPALAGLTYRVYLDTQEPAGTEPPPDHSRVVWTVRGVRRPAQNSGIAGSRYIALGRGLSREVKAEGDTISIQGLLPSAFKDLRKLYVSAEASAADAGSSSTVAPQPVSIANLKNAEVSFSSITPKERFRVGYEVFHYLSLPNARDLSCTVIKSLGDKFDLLAYYSDFRIDNQEAGTPSNGPMGGHVTGIGQTERGLDTYCSSGRFQWGFIQPVYVGSNQMQEFPPAEEKTDNPRDIDFYRAQLEERSPGNGIPPYDLAMSQIGHEMGHRWSAFASAKVNGETIPLGPTHWARGLQAPVPFPFQRPIEASAMGGGVWQDNLDGTFTQLDDDYYVPATGYSYLDLYLMGLIAPSEVPDFFLLRNLSPAGKDANGHSIFKADRVKVTIDDVIAVQGPRLPAVNQSQRKFNTGMVVVVEHGQKPSPELLERTNGIGKAWIDYWATVTGRRASMTTDVH